MWKELHVNIKNGASNQVIKLDSEANEFIIKNGSPLAQSISFKKYSLNGSDFPDCYLLPGEQGGMAQIKPVTEIYVNNTAGDTLGDWIKTITIFYQKNSNVDMAQYITNHSAEVSFLLTQMASSLDTIAAKP